MLYPAMDYIAVLIILAFLLVTLFICLFCMINEHIKKESEKRKQEFINKKGWNIADFSWFRYNQHHETGINVTMDNIIIVMISVNSRLLKKEYSLTSLTLNTNDIAEVSLSENNIITRKLSLIRPVSDDRPAQLPESEIINTIRLCIRQKDKPDDITFILYQGKLDPRGSNHTIIKGKANAIILLLKMLLINKA
ncbi:TPA: hypothetical protein RMT52_003822 [Escherichia coli]|uniref:hypothetical protein n=1 Tax=Escherichia coli TaxID=562 RepID=UPI0012FF81C2|nr:hypothetical protein [Escherichia coli]EGO4138822.1 hypothetical protein [Escherichia coli]EGO4197265.1 hypothetical protein [Escherichia coli]EHJ6107286.1 hypothetical protein [Escherichia coli]EHL6352896.1 hypothetical protein [Escherichia coli]EHL6437255.1 hypothetical protein [Escherichia coli]